MTKLLSLLVGASMPANTKQVPSASIMFGADITTLAELTDIEVDAIAAGSVAVVTENSQPIAAQAIAQQEGIELP